MAASDPIRLHWWKAVPNFGDALSALVVAHVSGRPVEHAGPKKADLFAAGSLMRVVRRNYAAPRADGHRPWLWGTGMLGAVARDFLPQIKVALVRGPITAELLGLAHRRFGDPGLLVNEIVEQPVREDHIGVVPHHTLRDHPKLTELVAAEPRLRLIDVSADAAEVCRQIGSCAHVLASSLHGLIVADAMGVPSTWVEPEGQAHLKYYDYAASVGRPLRLPLALDEVANALPGLGDAAPEYADGIAAARDALHETFPPELRAVSDTAIVA